MLKLKLMLATMENICEKDVMLKRLEANHCG